MIDPQKNLIEINRFTLFLLCFGCICVTVLVALPTMISSTGDAIQRSEIRKIWEKQK